MTEPRKGFNTRSNDNGSVIFHDSTPLVISKGLFVKMYNSSVRLEGLDKEGMKEIIKIAFKTKDYEKRDCREVFDMIDEVGENHCFRVHRGFVYDSMALFERELGKMK